MDPSWVMENRWTFPPLILDPHPQDPPRIPPGHQTVALLEAPRDPGSRPAQKPSRGRRLNRVLGRTCSWESCTLEFIYGFSQYYIYIYIERNIMQYTYIYI